MRRLKTLLLATFLIHSSPALATPGWGSFGYISEIDQQLVYSGTAIHGVWIMTAGTTVQNDNCSGTPTAYFLPDDEYSTPNTKFKQDLSLVMGAYLNSRPVAFYVNGCYSGTPIIGAIKVQ